MSYNSNVYIYNSIKNAKIGDKGDLPDERYFRKPTDSEMKVIPKMYKKLLNFSPLLMMFYSVLFTCIEALFSITAIALVINFLTRSYLEESLGFHIFFTVVVVFLLIGGVKVGRNSRKVIKDYIIMKKLLREGRYIVMDLQMCNISKDKYGNVSFNLQGITKDDNIILPNVMSLSSRYIRRYEKKYNRSVEDGKYMVVKLENGYYKVMENIC